MPSAMKFIARILFAASLAASALVAPAWANEAAKAEPAAMVKPDLTKGSEKFAAVCAQCHGADGNSGSPENPKLAGQHPEYLVKQLQEFKAGKRKNAVMSGMAAPLSDEDMRNLAYWAASQKQKAGFAKDKAQVTLGERIYKGGIADRQIAACAGCHSPTGAGIPSQYPRLAGQHSDYIAASLRGYRDGVRTNSPQMMGVAAKLNDREIKAVADYIAGLRSVAATVVGTK
jgi:cytochrome c553